MEDSVIRHASVERPLRVKSADRILILLEYLSRVGSASFGQIVSDLDLPNSSGHQLLQTGIGRGFVEYDEGSRQYRLGHRLWQIAQALTATGALAQLAKPVMDQLVRTTEETVQLSTLTGLENEYIAIRESPHPMKLSSSVGVRLPAHTTALGKVLLAALPEDELDSRIRGVVLERFTPNTITDHDVLKDELARIRTAGFAEDCEEYVIGCRCVAYPVRNPAGEVVAGLSVSAPTARFGDDVARRIHSAIGASVTALEQRLGIA